MIYRDLELKVLRWAEERRILQHSTEMAQALKTYEELGELLSAIVSGNPAEIKDAYGDILVTLIIGSDIAGFDLVDCLAHAYEQIKDRKGTLNANGVFVKE